MKISCPSTSIMQKNLHNNNIFFKKNTNIESTDGRQKTRVRQHLLRLLRYVHHLFVSKREREIDRERERERERERGASPPPKFPYLEADWTICRSAIFFIFYFYRAAQPEIPIFRGGLSVQVRLNCHSHQPVESGAVCP